MQRLYQMVRAADARFPGGVEPFQMVTRLLEECGEVAREVNHWEGSGIKRQKHGEPSKERLADELRQSMVALMQIAVYYSVEQEFEKSMAASLANSRAEGLIE